MNEIKYDVAIVGAGPAGLAAATKLVENGKRIVICEKEKQVGGISKTIEYHGYRFDLGGHRFFTKAPEVNALWKKTLGSDFLDRPRLSRMFYRNKFFAYPVKPFDALSKLGIWESCLILASYIKAKINPYPEEKTFEQWIVNRFGRRLFEHFFKSYTEKLWGIPCDQIQAEWAAQRIKGLSLTSAIKTAFFPDKKGEIKTLIDQFQYPKFGPGMMYQAMATAIAKQGGIITTDCEVTAINIANQKIASFEIATPQEKQTIEADWLLSSMPITDLVNRIQPTPPATVKEAASKLTYRSFVTISVILKSPSPFPDTWIYIHSPEVKMGRIQNFGNWSPHMLADSATTALGLEYFCTEGDDFWKMSDQALIDLGLNELEKIGLGKKADFVQGFVVRVAKTYPVYDSDYSQHLAVIKQYLAAITNLQTIGRYGMFKYNNMDHSILTGLYAAENILGAQHDIWSINADEEYHEEKK